MNKYTIRIVGEGYEEVKVLSSEQFFRYIACLESQGHIDCLYSLDDENKEFAIPALIK